MRFVELALKGAYAIAPAPVRDARGFFARTFDRREFARLDLADRFDHCAVSFNRSKGTLRGLHFQAAPYAQAKLVRCTRGAVYDVVVDLRRGSPTRGKWAGVRLTAKNRHLLYVPKGFAHGFQALEAASEVLYMISGPRAPRAERGFRWDDPLFGIRWPLADPIVSARDRAFAAFTEGRRA